MASGLGREIGFFVGGGCGDGIVCMWCRVEWNELRTRRGLCRVGPCVCYLE